MANEVVQILINEFGLKMSRSMRRAIDNHQHWVNSNRHPNLHNNSVLHQEMELDPEKRFINEAKTTRGRKGKRAFALSALKRYKSIPQASTGDQLGFIMKHINMDLGAVMDGYKITKKIGKRDVPNYAVLKLGQPYIAIESINSPYSYQGQPITTRLRIIIPRVISPRGTNVYGDEIMIEEPGYKSFLEKEGWRCFLSKFYDVDKPKGAGGKLTYLEDPSITLVHLPTLLNASDRPFPFLINWTLDSRSIVERFCE